MRKVESEMDDGVFVFRSESERTTFGRLLTRYRDEVTVNKKGAEPEILRINAILRNPICRRSLSTLTGSDFASYRDQRSEKVSPATVNKELSLLGHAIDIGIKEWGIYLPANPVRNVRRLKAPNARDRRLSLDEERSLMEALDTGTRNPWIKPIVQLAIETGMRRGEILSIEWENVNLDSRVIHLPDTKNSESRDVPLSNIAVKILSQLPRSAYNQVFPIGVYSLKKAFERAVARATIKDFRFHDLRHEATSRFFEKGLNVMEVASITGHKDLSMLKRYTHLRAIDIAKKL